MAILTREIVLAQYELFPFEHHPLWRGVVSGHLTKEQVLRAETQHYLRSKIGREFRKRAAFEAADVSARAHELLMETYKEECTDDESGPSHLALIERLLIGSGVSREQLEAAQHTPGNVAAVSIYKDITDRGPLHHMIGAGAVEYFYSILSPNIYKAYVEVYGFTEDEAETYRIHGPMDQEHAERALAVLDEAYVVERADEILLAVRDAFVATSLHYDGMLQAALGNQAYWSGR